MAVWMGRAPLAVALMLGCGAQALPEPSQNASSVRFCEQALAGSIDPTEVFTIPGVYTSDDLHGGFSPTACPRIGFDWSTEAMPSARRDALRAYMDGIRGDQRGGFINYPITLTGRIEMRRGRYGMAARHMVVADFGLPD